MTRWTSFSSFSTAVLLLLCATLASAQSPLITTRRVFYPATSFDNERFGSSVAADAATVVVGAIGDDVADPAKHGRVEVWAVSTDTPGPPTQVAVLSPAPSPADNSHFGASVAIYRTRVVVGAPLSDVASPEGGAAYVFDRVGDAKSGVWLQTAELLPPFTGEAWTQFGASVDVAGSTVVIGSYGQVAVFERDQGGRNAWGPVAVLQSDQGSDGSFGTPVAMHGRVIAVGQPFYTDDFDPDPLPDIGAVHVFRRDEGGPDPWVLAKFITWQAPYSFERMGRSLGLSAVSTGTGAEYLLAAGTGHSVRLWTLQADGLPLNFGGEVQNSSIPDFGRHLALRGEALVVSGDEGGASQAVALFHRGSGQWTEVARFVPSTPPEAEAWGHSLAVAANYLLVGSDFAARGGSSNAGWVSLVSD